MKLISEQILMRPFFSLLLNSAQWRQVNGLALSRLQSKK
jgi:hypothetical protein